MPRGTSTSQPDEDEAEGTPLLGTNDSPVRPRKLFESERSLRCFPLAICVGLCLGVWASTRSSSTTTRSLPLAAVVVAANRSVPVLVPGRRRQESVEPGRQHSAPPLQVAVPTAPAQRPAEPPECVPGRLCATPQHYRMAAAAEHVATIGTARQSTRAADGADASTAAQTSASYAAFREPMMR